MRPGARRFLESHGVDTRGAAGRAGVAVRVLLGLAVLVWLDALAGGPRFVSRRLDLAALFVALWLPLGCVGLLGFLPPSRRRALSFGLLTPFALLCLTAGGLSVLVQCLARETRQTSVRFGRSEIVTLYSETGAWDSGETVVQQEAGVLPGLVWVRPLSRRECPRDVQIRVLDRHHVRCVYPADAANKLDADAEDAWVF